MTNISGSNISIGGSANGFMSALDQAKAKVRGFALETNSTLKGAFRSADDEAKVFRGGLTRLGDDLMSLSRKAALVGTLPALIAVGQSYRDFAQMQMLQRGVERYGETLKDVRELAKLPNIGVFDGAKSLISLKAMRMESDLAKRSIKAFANAITDAGGSAADLDPALVNLRQFFSTKHINEVDLRQLANRIPQTMEALQNAFGTTDASELNKIGIEKFVQGFIAELEKIPPVAGGAQMSMDQFFDSLKFGTATLGEGADNAFGISSAFTKMTGVLDSLVVRFRELSPEAQKSVIQLGGFVALLPALTAGIGAAVKFLPMLATGLGISWPVAAIVGTVAALAGLVGIMTVAFDKSGQLATQIEDLNGQISKTEEASKKVEPLIAKYEELKQKAAQGADVQDELKKVIGEIASLVPNAATGFDNLGNALDINADKARKNNAEQLKLLATLRQMSVEAQKAQLALKTSRAEELQQQLNSGEKTVTVNSGRGVYFKQTTKLQTEDYKKAVDELGKLNSEIETIKLNIGEKSTGIFGQLGGESALKKEIGLLNEKKKAFLEADKAYAAANKAAWDSPYSKKAEIELSSAAKARKEAIDSLKKQQSTVNALNTAFGDSKLFKASPGKTQEIEKPFNVASASIEALENHLSGLESQYKKLDGTSEGYAKKQKDLIREITSTKSRIDALMSPISKSGTGGKLSVDEKLDLLSEKQDYKRTLEDKELVLRLHLERLKEIRTNLNPASSDFADQEKANAESIAAVERILANEQAKKVVEMKRELDLRKQLNKEARIAQGSVLDKVDLQNVYRQQVGQNPYLLLAQQNKFYTRDNPAKHIGMQGNMADMALLSRLQRFNVDTKMFSSLTPDVKDFLSSLDTVRLEEFFNKISTGSRASTANFSQNIKDNVETLEQLNDAIEQITKRGMTDGFITLGEALGNSISRVGEKAGYAFKMLMGNLLQEIGKTMVIYNTVMEGVKDALSGTGWGGVIAGVAAIAAGQLLKNSAMQSSQKAAGSMRRFATGAVVHKQMMAVVGDNPNSAYDPEVISPLSKMYSAIQSAVKSVAPRQEKLQVEVIGVVDGDSIRLVSNRSALRNNRLRGY